MLEDVKNDLEKLERLISESSELYIAETDAEKERYGSGKIDTQIYVFGYRINTFCSSEIF